MPLDSRGLDYTAASEAAVGHYDDMIRAYLGFRTDTGALLKATLSEDPEMPMAQIARGYFFHLFCVPALERKAVEARQAAEAAIAAHGANDRERLHLAALTAWNAGDLRTATERWEDVLLGWPHDVLALRLSHFTHFYLHGGPAMRESVARIMHAWPEDTPDYGYVLGVAAFAHEESGDYAVAEALGRQATAINPADIWATHAVAHVLEMQGRHREGVDWLAQHSGQWDDTNNFRFHTWWHKALYHLELGETDTVLDLYDNQVRRDHTEEYLDVTNGCAMLLRLEHLGIDVGERWHELADVAEKHMRDNLLAFADAHYVMALAADGRVEAADTMLAALAETASGSDATQAQVMADVGLPVCRATLALRQGNPDAAADLLLPLRDRIWRLGGSHAQRDIWQQMLVHALLRAGRHDEARRLLAQRTSLKPNSPSSWRWLAEALDGCGDTHAAAGARRQAEQILAA